MQRHLCVSCVVFLSKLGHPCFVCLSVCRIYAEQGDAKINYSGSPNTGPSLPPVQMLHENCYFSIGPLRGRWRAQSPLHVFPVQTSFPFPLSRWPLSDVCTPRSAQGDLAACSWLLNPFHSVCLSTLTFWHTDMAENSPTVTLWIPRTGFHGTRWPPS